MSNVGNKLRHLKYRLKHDFASPEMIALSVAILMCFVWTYQSIVAMSRNWELTDRLNTERKTLQLLEVEIETSELENEYYKTDEYKELAARRMLDKKNEGENMVVLPENSEAAKNKHRVREVVNSEPKEYNNFEKWMMYLFP